MQSNQASKRYCRYFRLLTERSFSFIFISRFLPFSYNLIIKNTQSTKEKERLIDTEFERLQQALKKRRDELKKSLNSISQSKGKRRKENISIQVLTFPLPFSYFPVSPLSSQLSAIEHSLSQLKQVSQQIEKVVESESSTSILNASQLGKTILKVKKEKSRYYLFSLFEIFSKKN